MREYIHFFENSDLRDTYEHGSDYTEPYVSYTPVLNEYKAQFNGEIVNEVKVKKIQGGYKISVPEHEIEEKEVLTNSDSFYFAAPLFIFPEDLNLTEESTEFTFDGTTYYLVYEPSNVWNVYEDSEHTQEYGLISKVDIVSIPSFTNTDFVHYNKVTPERITAKFIVVNNYATKDVATLSRKITRDRRLFEQIYINGTPVLKEEIPTRLVGPTDYSVYHTFEEEGTYDIEYILKEEYVGTIPSGLFPDYQYFSEINIPKGVTTIKSGAFYFINNYPYNTNPEINVIIPNTITLVEDEAVRCSSINSSTIQKFISINPNSVSMSACEK